VPETEPLFNNFAAFNLGIPKNDDIPFLYENKPDQYGVNPNPQGPSFIDYGLGAFLSDSPGVGQINPNNNWKRYEPQSNGKFQTATIRNVDKRPYPGFVKSYFHNGYMKSLKEVAENREDETTMPPITNRRRISFISSKAFSSLPLQAELTNFCARTGSLHSG
jgi:cytochrome c peroxidase